MSSRPDLARGCPAGFNERESTMSTAPTGIDAAQATMHLVDEAIAAPPRKKRAVSLTVARHVLFHLGDRHWGVSAGDFETRLMLAIDSADEDNRARLATVYPEHVIGLRDGRKSWGLAWLRTIVTDVPSGDPAQWAEAGVRLDAIAAEADVPRIGGPL